MTHGGKRERLAQTLWGVFACLPKDPAIVHRAWRALPPEDRHRWRLIVGVARAAILDEQDADQRAEHEAEVRCDAEVDGPPWEPGEVGRAITLKDPAGNVIGRADLKPGDVLTIDALAPAFPSDEEAARSAAERIIGEHVIRPLAAKVIGQLVDPLRAAASLDCQPKSQADAVYVSQRWRDGILRALASPAPSPG